MDKSLMDDQSQAAAKRESKAKWRNTAIAAASNLSTAFNLININLAHVMMENQYCGGDSDACKGEVTAASTAVLVGGAMDRSRACYASFGYVPAYVSLVPF